MRSRVLIVAALVVSACDGGAPIADADVLLHVTAGEQEVEFGKSFPLTVTRVWRKHLVPDDWNDRSLAPLVVRPVETTRREDARHVEETLRYRAYAFTLTEVKIPALTFEATPKSGGARRVASSVGLNVRVRPTLDPKAPGESELPGELLAEPFPWIRWSIAGAAVLVASGWWIRRHLTNRRAAAAQTFPAAPAIPIVPQPSPHERALQRIEELRARRPNAREEVESFYAEASSIVREYTAERFAVGAPQMTSEELVAAPRAGTALQASHRTSLGEILSRCDMVKFACDAPNAEDHKRLLVTAEMFVGETAGDQ